MKNPLLLHIKGLEPFVLISTVLEVLDSSYSDLIDVEIEYYILTFLCIGLLECISTNDDALRRIKIQTNCVLCSKIRFP